jgi:HlyD family secretion protein
LVVALLAIVGLVVAQRMKPKPIVGMAVVRGKAVEAVYATGTVEAEDRVTVKAKQSGSIAEIFVKEGRAVRKGDLLARIDNPGVTYDLKRGQADLSAANAQAQRAPQIAALGAQSRALEAERDIAKKNLARTNELFASGALPQAELDAARSRVDQIDAQIAAIKAQEEAVRIDLGSAAAQKAAVVDSLAARVADTEVRAPQDGVVLTKLCELGEVVQPNQPLFKVGDTSRLVLEVMVDEADVARVFDGTGKEPASRAAISLYAYGQQTFKGTVFDVLPDANRDRKAFLVKLRFDAAPPGLRSGMSGEVNIVTREHEGVLLAPSQAEDTGAVWVVEDGRAHKRNVKIGIRDLLRFEVAEGVSEGAVVVTEGQSSLAEGAKVSVTLKQADKLEPMPDLTQPKTQGL